MNTNLDNAVKHDLRSDKKNRDYKNDSITFHGGIIGRLLKGDNLIIEHPEHSGVVFSVIVSDSE